MKKRVKFQISAVFLIISMVISIATSPLSSYAAESTDQKVERLLSKMTLEQKVAQMMIVAIPASNASSVQKKYQFGGYILYARDFGRTNKNGMKKLIKSCQSASKTPMMIAVDEEGGTVVRASYFRRYRRKSFKSPSQVYKAGGYKGITKDTKTKDKYLKSLGINTNFAPVADVTYKKSDYMGKRAFSTNAAKTSKFIKLSVTQMNKDNVVSTLKHFPGYGGNGDTHGVIIRDKRTMRTFETRDLKPFATGIKAGTDMIMMSHTIVNAFDSKNPVSLSPKAVKYLREDMGFDGVIITDGLAMKGVTDFVGGSQGQAAVRAAKAGNDMLCVTGSYTKCYNALVKAAKSGELSEDRIDESVRRILRMKIKRGIIKK